MDAALLNPTESALIDVIRVALTGDTNGVQQLCRRYVRRPPASSAGTAVRLKEALLATVEAATPSDDPLRSAGTLVRRDPTYAFGAPAAATSDHGGWFQYPDLDVEPVYTDELRLQVEALINEHLYPDTLRSYGLSPSRAVLFTGPPGVGKSLSASYVAARLDLPLLTVNIASVMSSLMGRTGQNLQEVIARAAEQPMVLFLDEFDALAKSRDDSGDVGEVRRVVNVLLQQLDRLSEGSLLVAATNHPQLLDSAVHRRFDQTIAFKLPNLHERLIYLRAHDIVRREAFPDQVIEALAMVTDGLSQADLNNWILRTVRRTVVGAAADSTAHAAATPDISSALLHDASARARALSKASKTVRAELVYLATQGFGWTQRPIAEWLGISHVTVGSDLKRAEVAHASKG